MTRQPTFATFAALTAACITSPAWGAIDLGIVSVDNSALLTGYETSDLQITTDIDWTAGAILLELTSGSIYQHALGGTGPTTNGFLLSLFPELEFDTSVGLPGGNTFGAGGDAGGDVFAFSTTELDTSFYDVDKTDVGTFPVGRITLSNDATGSWSLALTDADFKNVKYEFSGTINNGVVDFQNASQFNGMTFVEVSDLKRKQYMLSLGIKFDEQGNRIWGPPTPMTLVQSTPDSEPATLPEPHTLAVFGLGLTLCLSGRRRGSQS